jgi:uncharacterized membrane protein
MTASPGPVARSGQDAPAAPERSAPTTAVVAPTRDDPVVAVASEVVGGPLGRHAAVGSGGWWTPVRVLLVLVFLVSGLGLLAKQPCRADGWAAPGTYVHACYSDIPPLFFGRGLADGELPYISQPSEPEDHRVEYPVLTGAGMWLTAQLVPASDDPGRRSLWYFDLNALVLAGCAAVAVVATARTAGRRPWDAALLALAPTLALTGTINWDLYAVALLAVGMLAWARGRPVGAGVLIGLATAAKFYPLFALGPLLVLCVRAGRVREGVAAVSAAVLAWLAVNVPVLLADFEGWSRFYALSQERGAGFSSVWFVLQQAGRGVPEDALNLVAGGLFVLVCLGVAVLALAAPRRPRLPQLLLLVVAGFLLTNKVYSPQYVLWLLPLAALARPRWRDFAIWQAGEVVHFVGIWMLLAGYPPGDAERALGETGYGLTVLAHVAGTLWLCAVVVRDVLRPEHDPVRADGSDDPAGGVLDGAPDAWRLPVGRHRGAVG